jgi:WhiB family transcriptional regulator, redox-sensing transcriptional regulator
VVDGWSLELNAIISRPAWHAQGACRGHDLALFFPSRGEDSRPAKAICGKCPVLEECRSWALDQGPHLEGIFGGLSNRQRRQHRRSDREAA